MLHIKNINDKFVLLKKENLPESSVLDSAKLLINYQIFIYYRESKEINEFLCI
jgi:hypothetical protein